MPSSPSALMTLRPAEGRRLIGQAVAALPHVRERTRTGRMAVIGGTTTRFVAEALTGEDPGEAAFAVGWIKDGLLGETPAEGRGPGALLFDQGTLSRGWPGPLLEKFGPGDIYVKGANALDPAGNAAILMGSPVGGTIGAALAILNARGAELLLPVSLEKLIPSVPDAARLGIGAVERTTGGRAGYMPIMAGSARVVTETAAMEILFNLRATPVAAGGSGESAGAITLHLAGETGGLDGAFDWLAELRG